MRRRPSLLALAGIMAVLVVLLAPFWLNAGSAPPVRPGLATPRGTACVEPAAFMRARHMQLLGDWRAAVRDTAGSAAPPRTYQAGNGQRWLISLQGTCLACHDKADFCDACHAASSVAPACWSCHLSPEGGAS